MKRILCIALCVLLLGSMTPAAFAEGESDPADPAVQSGEPEPGTSGEPAPAQPAPAAALTLDTENIYDGMDTAYRNGYTPVVAEGAAVVVLPLVSSGELSGGRLTASVELGDAAATPFVYKNYQREFSLTSQPINGTEETRSVYYVRFDLTLSDGRINGTYPVTLHVTAQDVSGANLSQDYTTYVTITDGIDPNAADEPVDEPSSEPVSAPAEETPTSAPVVLVTGYSIAPSPVEAGGSFEATVTLQNTSTIKSVQNMVVTVEAGDANFTLRNDSDTLYIGKLGKGESTELKFNYDVGQNTPEGQYTFNLGLSYDDPEAVNLSSSGRFSVSVVQPLEVEMTMPKVAASVHAGDTVPLSFQVLNLGRSKVYNVRCEVAGFGLLPTTAAFVGDMEPGTEGEASLNLFIGTKDMSEGYTGTEQYGSTTGTVTLSYENAAGEAFTQEFTFDTTIEKPVTASPQPSADAEQETAGQWWMSVAIFGGILAAAGIAVGAYLLGKRQR